MVWGDVIRSVRLRQQGKILQRTDQVGDKAPPCPCFRPHSGCLAKAWLCQPVDSELFQELGVLPS